MSEHYCPECADGWNGAYTCELRCTTCGGALKVRDCDPSRLNPEVEIKELNAVIDQLTERAEKAKRERAALAAHVERLSASGDSLREHWDLGNTTGAETRRRVEGWDFARKIAPETSLAKLKDERAKAIQQAVKQARREWAAQASPAVKAQWQAEALEGLIACCKKSPPGKSANDVLRVAEQMARAQRDLMRHQAEALPEPD